MPRISRSILNIILVIMVLAFSAFPVFAQQEEFRLGVNKNVGYSSGDQLRGSMRMYIIGSTSNIKSVEYFVDGKSIGFGSGSSFDIFFQTTDFTTGYHDLSATVLPQDGRTVNTATRRFNFVTAEEEASGVSRIIVPLLGVILAVMVVVVGAQVLFFRKKAINLPPGTQRNYGWRGGTICPRCKRPYAIHWWAMNAGLSRFDRCDYCGKWALVRAKSMEELRQAERSEIEGSEGIPSPVVEKSEEEKMREMIDKSKYSD